MENKNMPKILNNNQCCILLVVFFVLTVILSIALFFCSKKTCPTTTNENSIVTEEEVLEQAEAGKVGEITEEAKEKEILPATIFNTSGKILQVRFDSLLVEGDGSNFEDRKPRELTVFFTDSTITFDPGQKTKYLGMEGLRRLKADMDIIIDGAENIRGKTEFNARTISQ